MEKKIYEEPTVQKVEFDFKTRIAASVCTHPTVFSEIPDKTCSNS